MTKIKKYEFHELSSYLTLLEGEEFDALVEDIREFGQIELATLYEGKILDGRNRYNVCQILKIPLKVEEWKPSGVTGLTPLQYVISKNIMRRHLNDAQKSEIALLLVKREGCSFKVAAAKAKIKPTSLSAARRIKETAKKDKLIAKKWEEAKRGEIGIDPLYRLIKKREVIEEIRGKSPVVVRELEKEHPYIGIAEAREIIKIQDEELIEQLINKWKLERLRDNRKRAKDIQDMMDFHNEKLNRGLIADVNPKEINKKTNLIEKAKYLDKKYNIDLNDYIRIRKEQDDKCPICSTDLSVLKQKNIHVDHDHKTGKVRGILCNLCNMHLGWYEKRRFRIKKYLGNW